MVQGQITWFEIPVNNLDRGINTLLKFGIK